jgi:hypothetical protein
MNSHTDIDIDTYGTIRWYDADGHVHRLDGPAIIWTDGDVYWCLNGVPYLFHQWLKRAPISDEDKMMLRLRYE